MDCLDIVRYTLICHVIARNASYPYLHFIGKNNARDNAAKNYICVREYDNIYFYSIFCIKIYKNKFF